jgi:uncharacterized protein (UPF0147 family)
MKTIKNEIEDAVNLMTEVLEDRGVPRNVRTKIEEAKNNVLKKRVQAIDISNAIYLLDDISNDPNIPSYARTTIWEIISLLEGIKEKIK